MKRHSRIDKKVSYLNLSVSLEGFVSVTDGCIISQPFNHLNNHASLLCMKENEMEVCACASFLDQQSQMVTKATKRNINKVKHTSLAAHNREGMTPL